MIKTDKRFIPGLVDSIPIRTKDKDTGKTYVRIGSCTKDALLTIAADPDRVFEEWLVDNDITVDIDGLDFYIDPKETADNIKSQESTESGFSCRKACWILAEVNYPASLAFMSSAREANKDKFVFAKGEYIRVCRGEEWYGTKDKDFVYEESAQSACQRLAQNILFEAHHHKVMQGVWQEALDKAMFEAREVVLDENFYTSPVMTILSKLPERRRQSPDTEAMVFQCWRQALGIEKLENVRRDGLLASPDKFFYFASLAAIFGPHVNALSKYHGAGPNKVVRFDHWLPLMNAFIEEWNTDPYLPKTRAAFYRYVNNLPFAMKHLLTMGNGLSMAGQIKDVYEFVESMRNELYRQWKEEAVRGLKPSHTDYKMAAREVLLTLKR